MDSLAPEGVIAAVATLLARNRGPLAVDHATL